MSAKRTPEQLKSLALGELLRLYREDFGSMNINVTHLTEDSARRILTSALTNGIMASTPQRPRSVNY